MNNAPPKHRHTWPRTKRGEGAEGGGEGGGEGGEGKRNFTKRVDVGAVDRDVGSRVPQKGAMVHPRDRREINSSGVSRALMCVCVYVYYVDTRR